MKKILILILLVMVVGCAQNTIQRPTMLASQAELIRGNWDKIKIGIDIKEATEFLGPSTVYRVRNCSCAKCTEFGATNLKVEQLWYIHKSVKDPSIMIYLRFNHGKLIYGMAETMSGNIYLK